MRKLEEADAEENKELYSDDVPDEEPNKQYYESDGNRYPHITINYDSGEENIELELPLCYPTRTILVYSGPEFEVAGFEYVN